jgi:hypothetical protein
VLLLLLSERKGGNSGSQILVELIDTSPLRGQSSDDDDDHAALKATLASLEVTVPSAASLERVLSSLIDVDLQPSLDILGHWDPYGWVEFDAPAPLRVTINGDRSFAVASGLVRLASRSGILNLVFESPDLIPKAVQIEVVRRRTTSVTGFISKDIAAREAAEAAEHRVNFYAGTTIATLGLATLAYSLLARPGQRQSLCLANQTTECVPETRFASAGSVLVGPAGYSTLLAGLIWVGTEELFDGWWIPPLSAIAGGAISYGISSALNPTPGVKSHPVTR